MDNRLKKLKEFLIENEYALIVYLTENGCHAMCPCYEETHVYEIEGNNLNLRPFPAYAIRPYILSDIFFNAQKAGYDVQCVCFMVGDTHVNDGEFSELIKVELTEKEIANEVVLLNSISGYIKDSFNKKCENDAKKKGIIEGFHLIKELFLEVNE